MHRFKARPIVWIVIAVLALITGLAFWWWHQHSVATHSTVTFGTALTVSGKLSGKKGTFTVADARQPGGSVIIANSLDDAVSKALTPLVGKTVRVAGVTQDPHAPLVGLYLETLNGKTIVRPDQLTQTSVTLDHPHVDSPIPSATFDRLPKHQQDCLVQALGGTDHAKAFFASPGAQTDASAIQKVNACLVGV